MCNTYSDRKCKANSLLYATTSSLRQCSTHWLSSPSSNYRLPTTVSEPRANDIANMNAKLSHTQLLFFIVLRAQNYGNRLDQCGRYNITENMVHTTNPMQWTSLSNSLKLIVVCRRLNLQERTFRVTNLDEWWDEDCIRRLRNHCCGECQLPVKIRRALCNLTLTIWCWCKVYCSIVSIVYCVILNFNTLPMRLIFPNPGPCWSW